MNWDNTDIRPVEKVSQTLSNTMINIKEVYCIIEAIMEHGKKLNPESKVFARKFLTSLKSYRFLSHKQIKVLRSLQSQCDPDYLKRPCQIKK